MGMIPKTTNAEVKVVAGKGMMWLTGLVMTFVLANSIGNQFVHAKFRLLFMVYAVIVYLVLQSKSPSNPERPIWQGLIIWLQYKRSTGYYAGILGYAFKQRREHDLAARGKIASIRN